MIMTPRHDGLSRRTNRVATFIVSWNSAYPGKRGVDPVSYRIWQQPFPIGPLYSGASRAHTLALKVESVY